MGRPKSFVQRLELDEAKKSHNCQHSQAHRIEKGAKRLKATEGRSPEHYCVACAIRFIEGDIERLQRLLVQLKEADKPMLAIPFEDTAPRQAVA